MYTYSHPTTYNRVLDSPDSFSPTIMNFGLRPGEKGSGETGYQIVVTCVLNYHADYYINE